MRNARIVIEKNGNYYNTQGQKIVD
jgi:hypothetical protein